MPDCRRSRSRATRALAAVAVAVIVAVGVASATAASAQASIDPDSCDRATYDPGRVVAEGAALPAAVKQLTDAGVTVRVRVEQGLGPDVDGHAAAVQVACPSWRDAGDRAPTLLAVVLFPDTRKTGVYYGSAYAGALDTHWQEIETTVMNPRFAAGDVGSGLAAGLDAMAHAIGVTVGVAPVPALSAPALPAVPMYLPSIAAPNPVPVSVADATGRDHDGVGGSLTVLAFGAVIVSVAIGVFVRSTGGRAGDGPRTWVGRTVRGLFRSSGTTGGDGGGWAGGGHGGGGSSGGGGGDGGHGGGGSTSW